MAEKRSIDQSDSALTDDQDEQRRAAARREFGTPPDRSAAPDEERDQSQGGEFIGDGVHLEKEGE